MKVYFIPLPGFLKNILKKYLNNKGVVKSYSLILTKQITPPKHPPKTQKSNLLAIPLNISGSEIKNVIIIVVNRNKSPTIKP